MRGTLVAICETFVLYVVQILSVVPHTVRGRAVLVTATYAAPAQKSIVASTVLLPTRLMVVPSISEEHDYTMEVSHTATNKPMRAIAKAQQQQLADRWCK